MGEKNRPADIQVSPHLIQIAGVELHLFADVVGRLVEPPRLIAYTPEFERLRTERHFVDHPRAVVVEERVAAHAEHIEARQREVAEERHVRRRRQRIGAIHAVESRRQHADPHARLFGIVRCADKTEIDLLLERAVDVAVEDPAPEIVLAFRLLLLRLGSRRSRGQRRIPVTQRIAAAHTERILLRTGGE